MSKRRRSKKLPEPREVIIDSMSHEGRGIAHVDGKTVFVFGALEGERVNIQFQKSSRNFDQAVVSEIIEASPKRIEPRCAAFKVCGGCSFQHLGNDDQVEFKQRVLLEMMAHAHIDVGQAIAPLRADHWGYRKKARLGVKYVRKKARVLVGFRERNSSFIADMHRCEVLIPEVGDRLEQITQLVEKLDARESIPQIEVAADADNVVLVFRHLQELSPGDRERLIEFGKAHKLWIQLQAGGPDTVINLYPSQQTLYYKPLEQGDVRIAFEALDFVQVNSAINQQMVAQALYYLDLKPEDRVLDLFCGLGNFTLAMAQQCRQVVGIEGDSAMVERAAQAASAMQIDNTSYQVADLSKVDMEQGWRGWKFDKILLDPPRSGAQEIAWSIGRFDASRIVYVSCQPSSLVRDAAIICEQGYRMTHLGIMDMFPQTAHVESMAVFQRIAPESK